MSENGKRDGMGRAERHADPYWWECMLECGKAVAERQPRFTTDDVVGLKQTRHPNATTHEQRARGPVMRQMVRLGYCIPTEDWIVSRQLTNHNRPVRVWASRIHRT